MDGINAHPSSTFTHKSARGNHHHASPNPRTLQCMKAGIIVIDGQKTAPWKLGCWSTRTDRDRGQVRSPHRTGTAETAATKTKKKKNARARSRKLGIDGWVAVRPLGMGRKHKTLVLLAEASSSTVPELVRRQQVCRARGRHAETPKGHHPVVRGQGQASCESTPRCITRGGGARAGGGEGGAVNMPPSL